MQRPQPRCSHRPPCPGCPRFGEAGIAAPAHAALDALARECGLPAPRVHVGPALGHRHRVRLAVRGRAGSPKIGLFQSESHRIVHIPRCPIHHPLVNRVAGCLREAMRATGTTPYAEAPHLGSIRYLQVVVERSSQRAQVVLVVNDTTPDACVGLARELESRLGDALHSLWWNGHATRSNTILGPLWHRFCGEETVVERIADTSIHFPPGAFGQANLDLADELAGRVREWVPPGARLAELFCGCGALGLPLLERVEVAHFNERGADSLRGLERSLALLPPERRGRAHVHPGDATEQWRANESALSSCDTVLVDPPRRGLGPELVTRFAEQPPQRLLYVSCGLDSFLADTARLLATGRLRLTALEAFALFPFTEHVETLARFERR